jgi:hypothetical protein
LSKLKKARLVMVKSGRYFPSAALLERTPTLADSGFPDKPRQ